MADETTQEKKERLAAEIRERAKELLDVNQPEVSGQSMDDEVFEFHDDTHTTCIGYYSSD